MKALIFLILLVSVQTYAFPDTIRHGYANCTSCHVSPSGGGMTNSYGRSLSRELLSTWGGKDEENVLHGLAKVPEGWMDKFLIGGDARYISRREDNESSKEDEGFWMQAQFRLGVVYDKFKFLMAIGKMEDPRNSQNVRFVSPEYYAIYSLEENIHLRAGRFDPVFGLRLPDHNLWVKSDMGFVPWNEKDSVELIYEGETQFLSLAGFQSTSVVGSAAQITGYTLTFDQVIFETTRVGFSVMNSEGQGTRQKVGGGHAVIGWSEKFYSMLDYSRIWSQDTKKDVGFFRSGYEIYKGLTPFLQAQARFNGEGSSNDQKRFGLGLVWLPRPHFELNFLIETKTDRRENSNESSVLLHYYL